MNDTVLIELRSEELPPKSLRQLSEAFADSVFAALKAQQFTADDSVCTPYATPRRLALSITGVAARQPDRILERKGPALGSALDATGKPTPALVGFMRSAGVSFEQLHKAADGKSEYFVARIEKKGETLAAYLAEIVTQALKKLPIPKVMRWGDSEHQFVRPVHSLILLHGEDVVAGEVLGLRSDRLTLGHRFLSTGEIRIGSAAEYVDKLAAGKVIASFAERRAAVAAQLDAAAKRLDARLNPAAGLLDEVTALVEWPVVYAGQFEAEYLEVPQECLILTMQQNQKYFPLLDASGKLLNRFLIVSNMQVDDPGAIISGNERVVRPRLADARFFYNQDRKNGFTTRAMRLGAVVYHNKLGSLGDRAQRLGRIARNIAEKLGADGNIAESVGLLAKVDLLTDMVGEFPELQGIMGRYYALHDGLSADIADAIEDHYKPRFAGDTLPRNRVGTIVALADKLETLVGMFGIGQIPTGDRDPFALRRHALGVIRMLAENDLDLPLDALLQTANSSFAAVDGFKAAESTLADFIYERLAGNLREQGYTPQEVDAVVSQRPQRLGDIRKRLAAVRAFAALPESAALAAANKRVGNILKKVGNAVEAVVDAGLLKEDAEIALHDALVDVVPRADAAFATGDHGESLQVLAALRAPVDAFFDGVMVNADDPALRANRLGLLARLHGAMNRVADISKLSA